MQQDPSSWNKPLLYRNKSAATTSTSTATATAAAASAVVVAAAVAASSTATAQSSHLQSPNATSSSSALQPSSTIHPRSSASTPCLTSSHVRPNTNRNSDVLAIHPSFDLTKPSPLSSESGLDEFVSSPLPSPSSSLSPPTSHLDSINAIVAHQTARRLSSLSSTSQLQQPKWPQYHSKPALSSKDFLKDRAQDVEYMEGTGADRGSLGGMDRIDSGGDVDIQQDAAPTSLESNSSSKNNNSKHNATVEGVHALRKGFSSAPLSSRRDLLSAQAFNTALADVDQHSTAVSRHDNERMIEAAGGRADIGARGVEGELQQRHQDRKVLSAHVRVHSMDCATSSPTRNISRNSRMSPGDIWDPSASISPSSSGTIAASGTPSAASSSTSSPSATHSLSPSTSSISALSSSKARPPTICQRNLQVNSRPSSPLLPPHPSARTTLRTQGIATQPIDRREDNSSSDSDQATAPSTPTDNTDTTSGKVTHSSHDQTPSPNQRGTGRKGIFLPHFFASVRPPSSQASTSVDQPHQESRNQSADNQSLSTATTSTTSISASPYIVVTDVRSISFRDISTVPTLTTFGHRRTKRRNSSLSQSSSLASSALSNNDSSSASTTSLPSTSRRKRIKKSSHSTKTPWNLCTASCGCSKAHSPTAAGSLESSTELEHKNEHKGSERLRCPARNHSSRSMESTGRIRTISESEVAVSERGQSAHRLLQQRQQQRRSRQSSSHQQAQHEQSTEQVSGSIQDTITAHHLLHTQHPQHQHQHHHQQLQHPSSLTSQHPLQDTQSSYQDSTQDHPISHTQHHLRIQLHQDRDQHHKRQRSPQIQAMPFEALIPSPSSSPLNNMERLKRARHRSSTVIEDDMFIADDPAENSEGNLQMTERANEETTLRVPHKPANLQIQQQQQQQQQQHLARIHPFDSEPGMSCATDNAPTSGNTSVIPMMLDQAVHVEPSIHPLDAGVPTKGLIAENLNAAGDGGSFANHRASEHQAEVKLRPAACTVGTKSISVLHNEETVAIRNHSTHRPDTQAVAAPITQDVSSTLSSHPAPPTSLQKSVLAQSLAVNPAMLMLPITRETLRELDMFEIFKNPQLRHDIVFDPHLQFRPNFDGERGMVKRREADRFWREVGLELNNRRAVLNARREAAATMLNLAGLSSSSPTSRLIQQQAQQMCPLPKAVLLPRLIDELREILLSLLPAPAPAPDQSAEGQTVPQVNPERALLTSTLDPDLLLQELDHGVLDVHALFRFLGDSLKGHCAPMRDALVESMVNCVVDFDEIVRGIRMCFEILEWMKLDIANHQLRTLRPWLLDKSIDFEQKYFADSLTRGGTLIRTQDWFKRSWIQWESVKRSVIGQQALGNESSALSVVGSRRPSLAPTPAPASSDSDQSSGIESAMSSLTPMTTSFNAKRRSSIVRADIGENILDGVVNEGLLEMILRPHVSVSTMPETFELDHYRLLSFHNDFQDLTILCTLLILFRQLAQNCWTQQDLVEIKKVVWLLLTDENANFGANTNPGPGATATSSSSTSGKAGGSSGMKDIVVQIEFAARKVRERSKYAASAAAVSTFAAASSSGRRTSLAVETPLPTTAIHRGGSVGLGAIGDPKAATMPLSIPPSLSSLIMAPSSTSLPLSPAPSVPTSGLSASDTNLLTAWLDNALCRTSTLYMLIQKRLLIHFRRWLYLHSCSSMLVLSASCASLASALSMSSLSSGRSEDSAKADEEEEEEGGCAGDGARGQTITITANAAEDTDGSSQEREVGNGKADASNSVGSSTPMGAGDAVQGQPSGSGAAPIAPTGSPSTSNSTSASASTSMSTAVSGPSFTQTPTPELSPEEANKAAAEALAAKLSFNAAEMEAHGLTGLEDEMIALLEKVRAVSEFNKKVYGSWYRDLVKQGRVENWLD